MHLILISCGKLKTSFPTEARHLYQGSLFKKSYRYAEQLHGTIMILSAKHHLVSTTEVLRPYNLTLKQMSQKERLHWADVTSAQINNLQPDTITYLAGIEYYKHLPAGHAPLGNLPLGKRLQWLDQHTERKGFL